MESGRPRDLPASHFARLGISVWQSAAMKCRVALECVSVQSGKGMQLIRDRDGNEFQIWCVTWFRRHCHSCNLSEV